MKTTSELRVIFSQLEDKNIWARLGEFMNIKLPTGYTVHSHKTKKSEK